MVLPTKISGEYSIVKRSLMASDNRFFLFYYLTRFYINKSPPKGIF